MIIVRTLPLGTYQFTLTVDDGMSSSRRTFTVAVVTMAQAIDRLIALVQSSSPRDRPLIIFLRAALFASQHHRDTIAINRLMTFIRMVDVHLNFADSTSTSQLVAFAQTIIDALDSDTNPRADRIEITSIHRDHDGKALLKLAGIKGRIRMVETSTNMVNWVPIGGSSQTATARMNSMIRKATEAENASTASCHPNNLSRIQQQSPCF